MKKFFRSSKIICLSLIFIILMNNIASSFSKDNDLYAWRLVKDDYGEWKFVALPGLSRRNLKGNPPATAGKSAPTKAPANGRGDHTYGEG
ncbi:hypothetical protein RND81_02G019300 [Saponaria officinalis]|uniref:Uncharacterized protein n=1 Tax=Saponaria officinalis TaxID=3572 RepID=A0AAW1MPB1_SAPOF